MRSEKTFLKGRYRRITSLSKVNCTGKILNSSSVSNKHHKTEGFGTMCQSLISFKHFVTRKSNRAVDDWVVNFNKLLSKYLTSHVLGSARKKGVIQCIGCLMIPHAQTSWAAVKITFHLLVNGSTKPSPLVMDWVVLDGWWVKSVTATLK